MSENKVITTNNVLTSPPVIDKPIPVAGDDVVKLDGDEFMRTLTPEERKNITDLTEDDILTDAVVAKDLTIPTYLDLKPVDPIYVFRWVNRKYDGDGGNRYEQMRSIGFMNAEIEDVDGKIDPKVTQDSGGIVCGDVILMKIRKDIYYSYLKANIIKSNKLFNRQNVTKEAHDKGLAQLRQDLSGVDKRLYKGKLAMYIPNKTPLDSNETDV